MKFLNHRKWDWVWCLWNVGLAVLFTHGPDLMQSVFWTAVATSAAGMCFQRWVDWVCEEQAAAANSLP